MMDIDTAFILAAGRGERMRPLTDRIPKPLVQVAGKSLLQRHVENLLASGIRRIVINHAHLGEQITESMTALNKQLTNPAEILFSPEPTGGLETAGGINHALPLIDRDFFTVLNGDIWTDYSLKNLSRKMDNHCLAHLVLVPTPDYKSNDDFYLKDTGEIANSGSASAQGYTFSGLSILNRSLFDGLPSGKHPLAALFRLAIENDRATAEIHSGSWCDVGTIERLKKLRAEQNHLDLGDG